MCNIECESVTAAIELLKILADNLLFAHCPE